MATTVPFSRLQDMTTAIVLGSNSDIAKALTPMLMADGWDVVGWSRREQLPEVNWDLLLIALGRVAPVRHWWEPDDGEWYECFRSNLLLPIRLLRELWAFRNHNARVCFMAGSNPNSILSGYSAYNVSKMALLKLCEQLDHETPGIVFFALGPGITDTKIHDATKQAQWPNPRLERAMKDGSFTKMEDIYACLKWAIAQPKEVIGGRNICVSDPWKEKWFAETLALQPSRLKLRRDDKIV